MAITKKTVKDIDVKGKKVVMRVDFNVPMAKDGSGKITDDTRIVAALPSIKYVLDQGGSLVLMSHLGRPKGVKLGAAPNPDNAAFTLKPVAEALSEKLGLQVKFVPDCMAADDVVKALKPGEVALLENTRFYKAEDGKVKKDDDKKGIHLKKLWRTVLVMTIAIPQFVSLLYVAKLFDSSGIIGEALLDWGLIPDTMLAANQRSLWDNPTTAKILLIVINIWIGIPYVMLQATGILMNIPGDLYESARVDGASAWQQYTKITLPYMLFVTGPSLLTSFVGNLNNFNVIYLLTGGNPLNTQIGAAGGVSVGHTDLLITWLYKMALGSAESKYYTASVIGILIFVVCAVLSLIVYNVIPSTKNEEDYK